MLYLASKFFGRYIFGFLVFGSMFGGWGACSSDKLPSLSLDVEQADSTDTVLYVIYEGLDSVWLDSFPLPFDRPIELRPDTSRLRSVWVAHNDYLSIHRYELFGRQWVSHLLSSRSLPPDSLDTVGVYHLAGIDAEGKYRDMHELLGEKGRVALVFSSLDMKTHSRSERDSLVGHFPKDSLQIVYMMLTPSDSAALGRLRRDSLSNKAIVTYSDTLGLVSRMRLIYGIGRVAAPRIFIVDSVGAVKAYPALSPSK
ncbi:MAG: hypothetical protein Q4A61_04050 [Porphyromonadaceae bacterium]|nr:hypothetical protein [Porphyromonadaceae bacterium]